MRNMSFALTTPQVLEQTKDVTRSHHQVRWQNLKLILEVWFTAYKAGMKANA